MTAWVSGVSVDADWSEVIELLSLLADVGIGVVVALGGAGTVGVAVAGTAVVAVAGAVSVFFAIG